MKIRIADLKINTQEIVNIGNLSRFNETEDDLYKWDERNQLNNLNLFDWIRHTKSFHIIYKRTPKDPLKLFHPATYEEELPYYYIEFFSKKNDIIFDPFLGSGTTSIVANLLERRSIGIEINEDFLKILQKRFK
ncbi:MAG: DNA methyltransferase, partial [Promethearchaeota archaeon]